VQVGLGRIYSPLAVDTGTYGSLPADPTVILKQGILAAPVTLNTPAPVTAGFSINYLVEAQYADVDGNSSVLAFYNAANPASPLAGPGGLGASSTTQRFGTAAVQIKAGIAATTGTQTTPAPDSGFVGLYVVTVANGAVTITSGNIAQAPGAPFISSNLSTALTQALADARYLQQSAADLRYLRFTQQTPLEFSNGVMPTNILFPPGVPERYGAAGNGVADDTIALTKCISCNTVYSGNPGSVYGVSSVTFPFNGPLQEYRGNGSVIRGIATSQQACAVLIQTVTVDWYNFRADTYGGVVTNPNPNYNPTGTAAGGCCVWWYGPVNNSQWNRFYGFLVTDAVRGVVFGAQPGQSSTGVLQSENAVYGFRTQNCQNPWFANTAQGFCHFSEPIFFAGQSRWAGSQVFNWAAARAFENYGGTFYAQGGEVQHTAPDGASNFAADLQNIHFVGMNWETATAIQIIGPNTDISGGQMTMDKGTGDSQIFINSSATGVLSFEETVFTRAAGSGASSATPMIDSSANPNFEIKLSDTQSYEWRWNCVGGDVRLVKGGIPRYFNHRMSITGSDPNIYIINAHPTNDLFAPSVVDRMGYSTNGWFAVGIGGTLTNTTNSGPSGFLASQLQIVSASGAGASTTNATSPATVKGTGIQTQPKELFWLSGWVKISAGSIGALILQAYDLTGASISNVSVADQGSILTGVWTFVEGPVSLPSGTAYIGKGVSCNASTVQFTDLRLARAN